MKSKAPNIQELPLDIVGSTVFGRYPKISIEQTFNQIISDDWLVVSAGYKKVIEVANIAEGRAIFSSPRFNKLLFVVNNGVYSSSLINNGILIYPDFFTFEKVGTLETYSGDVFIDENNARQIAICDRKFMYIYDYSSLTFNKLNLDFTPQYVSFQDTRFISVDKERPEWRLSQENNGNIWPADSSHVGLFQTKPDKPVAAIRVPGKGNLLFVFGNTVTEAWYDLGYQLFPYQRQSYFNIDYGCLNPATIATNDNLVVWLGANEKSGPVIMYSDGGTANQISTDGINFKLASLLNPRNSYGFLFKQDGHQIYQITFPDDRLTYSFDFNTKKIFTFTDQNFSNHISKRVVFFNDTYYFVSFSDGNVYELNSKFTTYDGNEIPRVRQTKSIRMPNANRYCINNMTFPMEQGQDSVVKAVDLSLSKDGSESFGNVVRYTMNPIGKRRSRVNFWNLGSANDCVPQFRFYGEGRFIAGNGLVSVYQ